MFQKTSDEGEPGVENTEAPQVLDPNVLDDFEFEPDDELIAELIEKIKNYLVNLQDEVTRELGFTPAGDV